MTDERQSVVRSRRSEGILTAMIVTCPSCSSKYRINGKDVLYSEVQVLLKSKGIDLDHDRFLIL